MSTEAENSQENTPQHPRHELSDVLHQPGRFSIAATLYRTETMDFRTCAPR
ncbi:hypothetical protein AAGW05_13330 [Arthrobacter sp. LAPM80]|uniref:hypothetical protein n=1 Tax=Arthrobacter sp. LAPM80 TaxID=3141788 RepID=UPI00398B9815